MRLIPVQSFGGSGLIIILAWFGWWRGTFLREVKQRATDTGCGYVRRGEDIRPFSGACTSPETHPRTWGHHFTILWGPPRHGERQLFMLSGHGHIRITHQRTPPNARASGRERELVMCICVCVRLFACLPANPLRLRPYANVFAFSRSTRSPRLLIDHLPFQPLIN
jgi:hypothetical protein